MQTIELFFSWLNTYLWGVPMIVFLLGTHIILSIKTKFIQRKIFKGIKLSIAKDEGSGDINHFQALTTALASTIGTGNIIGVATAITLGGPGAVFWTWITGILGIATKYAESFIAIKYRYKTEDGRFIGGAMVALKKHGHNILATAFAIITALCAFGIGCSVQSNAIVNIVNQSFNISPYLIGTVIVILTAIVTFGGVKSISKVCETLVPFMALIYFMGCLYILFYNRSYLLETINLIIYSAFNKTAISGGFIGSSIMIAARFGIARGLFSNESGLGSSPIVSACAKTNNACKQALISATGTFWDTVIVCLITGLVLVSTIIANPDITSVNIDGATLASNAFAQIPFIGSPLLLFGIITFAFSTILGWSYYGEACLEFLFGQKVIKVYRVLWIVVAFLGCIMNLSAVWQIADSLNALMAIPNVIAVFLLLKVIVKDTNKYIYQDKIDEIDNEIVK